MVFRKYFLLVLGLLALLVFSGCGEKAPNIDAQKKVLTTYLEGIRDHNKEKMEQTAPRDIKQKTLDPDYKQAFESFDANSGRLKSWTFTDEKPWVDDINGQTIIQTELVTTKKKYLINFDLRRSDNKWTIFGIKQASKSKPSTDSDPYKEK